MNKPTKVQILETLAIVQLFLEKYENVLNYLLDSLVGKAGKSTTTYMKKVKLFVG